MLDEPTNDLDLETLDLLQEVIADYDGTVLIVSHDRDFLDRTVTITLGLDGSGKVDVVAGGYEDWVRQRYEAHRARRRPAPRRREAPKARSRLRPVDPGLRRGTRSSPTRTSATTIGCRGRSTGCRREVAADERALHDPDLYTRDPDEFAGLDRTHCPQSRRDRGRGASAGSKSQRWRKRLAE